MKTNIAFLTTLTMVLLQAFSTIEKPSNTTAHVIMFVEDDRSELIFESCQKDAVLIKEELRMVEKYTGMRINYYATSFNKNSLQRIMPTFNCETEDVILFYYNGHGYNRDNSDFPCLNFNEPSNASPHVNLSDVHNELKGKGARLVLTIGDCCNNLSGSYKAPLSGKKGRALQYIKLFKNYKGDVIVTSSKRGQYSYVYQNGSGSYFTLSFLNALHEAIESGNSTWSNILEQARRKTIETSKRDQEPYFIENIKLVPIENTHEN